MKLNAIKAVCTKAKKFVLYTDYSGKAAWIGTDTAMYPIEGILIDENSIESLFDIQESKLEKLKIETVPMLQCPLEVDFDEIDEDMLMCVGYSVYCGGALNRMLSFDGKLYSVDVDRLKPAEISSDYARYYFSVNAGGEPIITVRDGLIVTGLLKPNEAFITELIQQQGKAIGDLQIEKPYAAAKPATDGYEQLEIDGEGTGDAD